MSADWENWEPALLAFVHDPPGKALNVRGHEHEAEPLAQILGVADSAARLHADTRTEDILASSFERVVPLPNAGPNGERAVGPLDGKLTVVHPLSGESHELSVPGDVTAQEATLRRL